MLWLFKGLNLSPWLTAPLLLALILVGWAWLWLTVTKVSAHGLGMGALTGMALALFTNGADWSLQNPVLVAAVVPLLFLLSCLVSAARLSLGAHSPIQVLHGWLAGLIAFGVGLPWMT
jgi:ABC-type microcin C transport system permease subunit YejE